MSPTIPTTLEEALDPSWLSAIVGGDVARVEPGPTDNRVSTNQPVHLLLSDGSTRDLWIKGYFSLIALYFEQLRAAGVDVPSGIDVWRGYRRGLIHGFYPWAITLRVDPRITTELITRLGVTVDDHDAYREVPA